MIRVLIGLGKFEGLDESEKHLGISKSNFYGNLWDIPIF